MEWIKEVIVDILVTVFIIVSIWLGDIWMWWVLVAYTGLLLVAKATVLMSDGFLSNRSQKTQQAPNWFLHLLYGINIILLGYIGWWYLLGGWTLIWLFSFLSQRKTNR